MCEFMSVEACAALVTRSMYFSTTRTLDGYAILCRSCYPYASPFDDHSILIDPCYVLSCLFDGRAMVISPRMSTLCQFDDQLFICSPCSAHDCQIDDIANMVDRHRAHRPSDGRSSLFNTYKAYSCLSGGHACIFTQRCAHHCPNAGQSICVSP